MPSWVLKINDTFARANSALGGVGNGWVDPNSMWEISGDELVSAASGSYTTNDLYRQLSEASQDHQITAVFEAGSTAAGLSLRNNVVSSVLQRYVFLLAGGELVCGTLIGSSFTNAGPTLTLAGYDATHRYQITASAVGINPTVLTIAATDLTTATDLGSASADDSTAALQGTGTPGTTRINAVVSTISDISTYVPPSGALSVSPSTLAENSTAQTITLTGTSTSWASGTPGTPAFTAVSAGVGFVLGGQVVASGTSATLTVTNAGSPGTITVTDPSTGATATVTVPGPVVGTLSLASTPTASQVVLAYTGTTGGSTPLTQRLYRSTTSAFVPPGVGTLLATSPTYPHTDTPPDTQVYYYKHWVEDNASLTGVTIEVPARLLSPGLNLGFIGDSITYGAGSGITHGTNDPATLCGGYLSKMGSYRAVTVSNQGVSGTTTLDWVPTGTYLAPAKAAFAAAGVTYVHIMLGTNDGWAGYTVSEYQTNLIEIVNNLVAAGFKVVLSYSPAMNPALEPTIGDRTDALLQEYQPGIDNLVNGSTVFQGDKLAFGFFANNAGEMQTDGIHPNAQGAADLGLMWAFAINAAVSGSGSGGAAAASTPPLAAVNSNDTAFTVQGTALTGKSVYGVFDSPAGLRWNTATSAFEPVNLSNWGQYAVAGTEVGGPGTTGLFSVVIPGGITTNYVNAGFYVRAGGSPAPADQFVGTGEQLLQAGYAADNAAVAAEVAALGVTLGQDGLDGLIVDPASGLNARQVLQGLSAVLNGTITIDGLNLQFNAPNSSTPRVTSVTDGKGARLAVNLSLD
jgi:lysophospholipase L1-like esterase